SNVFDGDAPLAGAAARKSAAQLAVAVHGTSALASALSLSVSTVTFDGIFVPGESPVLMFASVCAVMTAFVRPSALVALAPRFPPLDRNGANAKADATVVSSSSVTVVEAERLPHRPTGAMNQSEALLPRELP